MSMKYDFTTILNREGTGAIAVSKIPFDNAEIKEGFSKIPMWVADMNYATAPSVIEAIQNRLAHPVFGYFDIKDAYSESIIEWQKTRNGVTDIPKEAIDYEMVCLAVCLLYCRHLQHQVRQFFFIHQHTLDLSEPSLTWDERSFTVH